MQQLDSLQHPAFDLVVGHLEQASVELFAGYAIDAELVAPVAAPFSGGDPVPATLAVIGFVGPGVRGSLVMVALESAVASWLELMGEPGGDPADVLGEFANMLLGRLKTRLLAEGLALQVSTPAMAFGNGIRLSTPSRYSRWTSVAGAGWQAEVRLDATFDPDFALQRVEEREAAAQAGDAIFF